MANDLAGVKQKKASYRLVLLLFLSVQFDLTDCGQSCSPGFEAAVTGDALGSFQISALPAVDEVRLANERATHGHIVRDTFAQDP